MTKFKVEDFDPDKHVSADENKFRFEMGRFRLLVLNSRDNGFARIIDKETKDRFVIDRSDWENFFFMIMYTDKYLFVNFDSQSSEDEASGL